MQSHTIAALLLLLMTGCATSRLVRLDTGQGPPLVYRSVTTPPIEIPEEEFKRAVVRLVLGVKLRVVPEASGAGALRVRLVSVGEADQRWRTLEAQGHSLEERLELGAMERRMLALSFAFDTVWEGVGDAIRGTTNPEALRAAVVSTIGTTLLMLVAPEPLTKLVAVALTACLIAYIGVGPVWNVGRGFLGLMAEATATSRIGELKEAGHRFGRVLGDNGARVLVLVALAALGGESALASEGPSLPGFAQAVLRARSEAGFELTAALAGEVHALALPSAVELDIALAPGAVAAVAMGPGGGVPGDPDGEVHHICTDKNEVSGASGGPWTRTFERYFQQAGMKLGDAENQVRIKGHKGPHPREYHEEVSRRIERALSVCRNTAECRAALVDELARIARELTTAGTRLRKLVTRNPEA